MEYTDSVFREMKGNQCPLSITQAPMITGYKNWFTFSIWTYAGYSAHVENFIFKGVKAEFPYVEEIDFCLSKDQTLFWHNGTGSVVGKESQ